MRRRAIALAVVAVALGAVSAAMAGGWATVKLSSSPRGIHAGEVWDVRLTILQHGVRPLAGVTPAVLISKGDVRRRFPARATATVGVYRARVVFPTAGTWTWKIDDGFTRVHGYAPLRVAPAQG
jgi:hypothetical protein